MWTAHLDHRDEIVTKVCVSRIVIRHMKKCAAVKSVINSYVTNTLRFFYLKYNNERSINKFKVIIVHMCS